MKKIITLIAIMLFSSAMFANAQINLSKQPYVEIQYTASQEVEPDRFEVVISLNEADSKGKITLATMEEQLSTALKEAGVDSIFITSQSSSSQKKQAYQYKKFSIILKDAEQVNTLFMALANNNVTSAQLTKAWTTKKNPILEDLQTKAILGAQNSARQLANAIGQSIGKAIEITDRSYFQDGVLILDQDRLVGHAKYGGTYESGVNAPESKIAINKVAFKKINLQQSVAVRFELK